MYSNRTIHGDRSSNQWNKKKEVVMKKKNEERRWTDILQKQGSRWLLIGDNGGANEKKYED
jgi:hypothetical protein